METHLVIILALLIVLQVLTFILITVLKKWIQSISDFQDSLYEAIKDQIKDT